MHYRHYCLQFPPSIQADLKLRYKKWFADSLFLDTLEFTDIPGTLILPANLLLEQKILLKCPRIIAFGTPAQLEPAFLAGAHDFLKDPWNCGELIIRTAIEKESIHLKIDNHDLCFSEDFLCIDDQLIKLSIFQTRIMYILIKHPNKIVSYNDIQEYLRMSSSDYINSLHVHINRIRNTLRAYLPGIYGESFLIENNRSLGYCLKVSCV